jgi:uncharacterized membrane protein
VTIEPDATTPAIIGQPALTPGGGTPPTDVRDDELVEVVEPGDDGSGDGHARQPGWQGWIAACRHQLRTMHPAAWTTLVGALTFAAVFGSLGVKRQDAFGTWSFDLGIYDQGFWLVSRGGQTFMTVRGLDFWGQHVNLIAYLFAPFYWLGAGARFLFVVQAIGLGAGAIPTYLIARDRLRSPWMGGVFAFVFLMYAPIQWISWANFHPEALVITPFLFAWWFASNRRWRWCFAMLILALAMREDTALAVIVMGVVVAGYGWRSRGRRGPFRMGGLVSALGVAWYALSTKLFIPHFNDGAQPFYIEYFYGSYGKDIPSIVGTIVRHPSRVVRDATKPDRTQFYRDLSYPLGGILVLGVGALLMAAPQMLASVIGSSPYARQIHYQYTSVIIAPLIIASIEGAWVLWRFKVLRWILPVWLIGCACWTNVQYSPSPMGDFYAVWGQTSPRTEVMREAVALIPDSASVTATYTLLPHLAHREHIYDWPNPFVPAYWGNDDCKKLPSPTTVEYVVIDKDQVGVAQQQLVAEMFAPGGPYVAVFDESNVVVGHRVGTSPSVDVVPQAAACARSPG